MPARPDPTPEPLEERSHPEQSDDDRRGPWPELVRDRLGVWQFKEPDQR